MRLVSHIFVAFFIFSSCSDENAFVQNAETSRRSQKAGPDCDPKDPSCNEVRPVDPCEVLGTCGGTTRPPKNPIEPGWVDVDQTFSSDIVSSHELSFNFRNPELLHDVTMRKEYRDETRTFAQLTRERVTDSFQQGYEGNKESEVFDQIANRKLDIALVIDNSNSMEEEQKNLGEKLSKLLTFISESDWQIAVTTTDAGVQCARDVIKKSDASVETRFKNAVNAGIGGSGNEKGIFRAREVLAGINCKQGPWVRSDSAIAVMIVSDEDNCSDGKGCGNAPEAKGEYLTDYLASIRKLGSNARIYGLIWHPSQPKSQCSTAYNVANIYADVISKSSGTWGSICDSDYSKTLEAVSKDISVVLSTKFTLSKAPIPSLTKVYVDGVEVKNGFKLSGNVLEFDQAPKEKAKIKVEYTFDAKPVYKTFNLSYPPAPQGIQVSVNGKLVPPTEFEVDFAKNEITFARAPDDRAEIRVNYLNHQPLLREFDIGTDVLPTSIQARINGSVAQNFTYDPATGKVKFAAAPQESSLVTITFKTSGESILNYPFNVRSVDTSKIQVYDIASNVKITANFSDGQVRFPIHEFSEGRIARIKYLNPSKDPFVLHLATEPIAETLWASDGVVSCDVNSGIYVQGNVVSVRDCGFEDTDRLMTLKFGSWSGTKSRFEIAGTKIPDGDSRQLWLVTVNDLMRQDYSRVGNAIYFGEASLPKGAKVRIRVRFEKSGS